MLLEVASYLFSCVFLLLFFFFFGVADTDEEQRKKKSSKKAKNSDVSMIADRGKGQCSFFFPLLLSFVL